MVINSGANKGVFELFDFEKQFLYFGFHYLGSVATPTQIQN